MRSLRRRLGVGLALSLVVLFSLMAVAVDRGTDYLMDGFVATRLAHDAELLQRELKIGRSGLPLVRPRHIPPIFTQPHSGHYYRIEVDGTVLQSASQRGQDLLPPAAGRDGRVEERDGPDGQYLLLLHRELDWQGRRVRMVVAEDLLPFEHARREFLFGFLWAAGVALAALVMLQTWVVGRGLRPLARTRRELRELQHGELDRLTLEVPSEVQPVVAEVNALLDVLHRRLERSRKALGNLTHALKTPLTLLAELADRPLPLSAAQLQAELGQQVEVMRRLMVRELRRARLAGSIGSGQAFIVQDEVPPLVDALRRMYRDKDIAIETRVAAGLRLGIERQDLIELLGNLLDNACKWCSGRVRLTLADAPVVLARVEDDGPGLAPEQVGRLLDRGSRLDERSPGHGLGLGIVQDIVQAYNGEIEFGRSNDLGGLSVQVQLDHR